MPSMFALAAPVALILPMIGQSSAPLLVAPPAQLAVEEQTRPVANQTQLEDASPILPSAANPLNALHDSNTVRQVRIEQRVTVRISPARPSERSQLLAQAPQQGLSTRFEERKMDKCLPLDRIAGVQTGSGNRLLLFLRDRRIISINLEKTCLAREFYSGFYVDKNEDGKLCVSRDRLQSRSGAKCQVARMRRLVAVND